MKSYQVYFYCSGSAFGIIVMWKNEVFANQCFQMALAGESKSDCTFLRS